MVRQRRIRNQHVESSQSGPHRFQFNIAEENGTDDRSTRLAGTATLADIQGHQQQQVLTSNQLQQLFARANTKMVAQSTDQENFFKRETTMKPPKTSKHIQAPFPPPLEDRPEESVLDPERLKQLTKEKAGPLIIERYSPNESEINYPIATVTMTFNQPMISVSTLDDMSHVDQMGISLTPAPEGRWRWTGARTIQYEPKHRLPYSTRYVLKVNKNQCTSVIEGKSMGRRIQIDKDLPMNLFLKESWKKISCTSSVPRHPT